MAKKPVVKNKKPSKVAPVKKAVAKKAAKKDSVITKAKKAVTKVIKKVTGTDSHQCEGKYMPYPNGDPQGDYIMVVFSAKMLTEALEQMKEKRAIRVGIACKKVK